ncbi:hypothetical protein M5689_015843 [Euphorbia peplus]|nr:hypothetical protein M5689_015843 [Euphorbia peplus]
MAKNILGFFFEVAPPPIIFPHKPSNCPCLETIAEEDSEAYGEDSGGIRSKFLRVLEQFLLGFPLRSM